MRDRTACVGIEAILVTADIRTRLRVAVAEYEGHRERAGEPDADPDASWWYAAWGEHLVPVLKELIAEGG